MRKEFGELRLRLHSSTCPMEASTRITVMTVIKMMAMTVMDGTEKKSGNSKAGNTE